jgi:uracil phosphoribosyltransferase
MPFFSALQAIEVLTQRGVSPEKIVFINLIAAPEGIEAMRQKYVDCNLANGHIS